MDVEEAGASLSSSSRFQQCQLQVKRQQQRLWLTAGSKGWRGSSSRGRMNSSSRKQAASSSSSRLLIALRVDS